MAQALDPSELVTFKELLITNSIQVDTLTQLMIDKGIITYRDVWRNISRLRLWQDNAS